MLSESLSVIVLVKYTPVTAGSSEVKCSPSFRCCSPQDNNPSAKLTKSARVRTMGIGNMFRYMKTVYFFSATRYTTLYGGTHIFIEPFSGILYAFSVA